VKGARSEKEKEKEKEKRKERRGDRQEIARYSEGGCGSTALLKAAASYGVLRRLLLLLADVLRGSGAEVPIDSLARRRSVPADFEENELLVERLGRPYLFSGPSDHVQRRVGTDAKGDHKICRHDDRCTGYALYAVHENGAIIVESVPDELTCRRQVDEQVRERDVLHRYAQGPNARCGKVGRDGVGADRNNIRDAPIGQGPGRTGRENIPQVKSVNDEVDRSPRHCVVDGPLQGQVAMVEV